MKTETSFKPNYGGSSNTTNFEINMVKQNEGEENYVAKQRMIDREMGDAADINLQF